MKRTDSPQSARSGAGRALVALLLLTLTAAAEATTATNIILFIGDGMGNAQVKAAAYYKGTNLVFEAWPHQAGVRTFAANSSITDSAAGATAMATGHKVNNGVISRALPGDGRDLETVLEFLKRRGKRTGLVTTTSLTHATPASFGAHANSRSETGRIATNYIERTRPDLLLGGGDPNLSPQTVAAAGYAIATNGASLATTVTATPPQVAGLFGSGNMPYVYDGLGELPPLADMTTAAIALLSHAAPQGFFLMVEGGRIDHAGHANDIIRNVHETLAFDAAIAAALAWASNRTDTLLLVTADHETGGLTVLTNNGPGIMPTVAWSSSGHTATNVTLAAWGVGAEAAVGLLDNTDVYRLILRSQAIQPEAHTITATATGGVAIVWDAMPLDRFRLETNTNLMAAEWATLITTTASTHVLSVIDTPPATDPQRFYRLQREP